MRRFRGRLAVLARCSGVITLVASIAFLAGCGGGTTGTGGTGSVIEGRLLDTVGTPVPDALLTVEETGDSGLTDTAGAFSIETEIQVPEVTLLVETGTMRAEAVVDELPSGEHSVDLDLELDAERKTVEVKAKRVRPRPTRTPRATPTSKVTPQSTATPEPTPDPVGTLPPQETATPDPTTAPAPIPTTSAETPTPTPTAVVSVTPTETPIIPLKTKFTGTLHAADPRLLIGAEVNIAGKGRRSVELDGTFKFFVLPSNLNSIFVIHSGGKAARVFIAGVSHRTSDVHLEIELSLRPNGSLKASILSAELLERTGEDGQSSGTEATDGAVE